MYENTQTQEVIIDKEGGWAVTKTTTITHSLEKLEDYKTRLEGEKADHLAKVAEINPKLETVNIEIAKLAV